MEPLIFLCNQCPSCDSLVVAVDPKAFRLCLRLGIRGTSGSPAPVLHDSPPFRGNLAGRPSDRSLDIFLTSSYAACLSARVRFPHDGGNG